MQGADENGATSPDRSGRAHPMSGLPAAATATCEGVDVGH
jgi:hypothetical protein